VHNRSNPLSRYEKQQVKAIEEWKQQEPSVVSKTAGYLLAPITWLIFKLIPQAAIRAALDLSNAAGKWMAEIGTLKSDAGVNDFAELLHAELKRCDGLADSVHNWAIRLAATEGGVTGFFGLPGLIADIPLIISFALRTIHRIGLAYGFKLETEDEKRFALGILSASGAATPRGNCDRQVGASRLAREKAAFLAPWIREPKFWPPSPASTTVYGDRNLFWWKFEQ
jgi:hypothetical protein